MRTIIATLVLAVGIALAFPTLAQADSSGAGSSTAPMRITADEAVALALRNNLGLQAARIEADSARRASSLSWNRFMPEVNAGGALHRLNRAPEDLDFGAFSIPGGYRWGLAGSLSASLSINLAMFEEMRALRLDFERGLVSYATARARLERDTRRLYHGILLMHEHVALLHGSLENAERQAQIAQANFNAGVASELALLQAQVARDSLRPSIDQTAGGALLLEMQFAMLLGLPRETRFELSAGAAGMPIIDQEAEDLIRRAADGHPDVQALRRDILAMGSAHRSGRLWLSSPTLTLGWNADPTFGGDPLNEGWFQGDYWSQQQGAFTVMLGFRLNGLLPFGTENQALRALGDQIRIANIALTQTIRATEIEIHGIILTLERLRLSAQALEQTVELAQRSFQLAEQAYLAGVADLLQAQNAELALRQVRAQLLELHFEYLGGLIDLEYALGVPFGSLASSLGDIR